MQATEATGKPHITCPFPSERNPHEAAARQHLARWVRERGLVRGASAWARFERADFAGFASATYPSVSRAGLELVSDWFGWLFVVDDQLDDGGVGTDPQRVRAMVTDLLDVLDRPGESVDGPAALTALAELWQRSRSQAATAAFATRFVRHLSDCLHAAHWEATNRARGIVPDETTYRVRRRDTGAIYVCMDLIEAVTGIDVPDQLYDDPVFQDALGAACDVVCWTNDMYSLDKERAMGEHHNLVHVVRQARKLDRAAALDWVAAAISARTERFVVSQDAVLERVAVSHPAQVTDTHTYLAGMRSWMRGNLDWSRQTRRYRQLDATASTAGGSANYLEPSIVEDERDGTHHRR